MFACMFVFTVMLPFGAELFKYLADPFNFDQIGSVAKKIIAERTKANGGGKANVSYCYLESLFYDLAPKLLQR